VIPPPALDAGGRTRGNVRVAILAGGCFWGVQGVFQHLGRHQCRLRLRRWRGEDRALQMVTSGSTGHAEAAGSPSIPPDQLRTHPAIYFSVAHDPTRSTARARIRHAISFGHLPTSPDQSRIAKAYIAT